MSDLMAALPRENGAMEVVWEPKADEGDPSEPGHPDNPRSSYDEPERESHPEGGVAGKATGWPGPAVIRVMPPTPVYDHKSMRESGRPKPHIMDPTTLNRTFCGKNPDWWRLQSTPAADFDFIDFTLHGCATCAQKALKVAAATS